MVCMVLSNLYGAVSGREWEQIVASSNTERKHMVLYGMIWSIIWLDVMCDTTEYFSTNLNTIQNKAAWRTTIYYPFSPKSFSKLQHLLKIYLKHENYTICYKIKTILILVWSYRQYIKNNEDNLKRTRHLSYMGMYLKFNFRKGDIFIYNALGSFCTRDIRSSIA